MSGTIDRPSPSDIFPQSAIKWNSADSKLEIDLSQILIPFTKTPKVSVSSIPGTISMDPVFDKEHNNIYIAGADGSNQQILVDWLAKEWFDKKMGNIIVYRVMANPDADPWDFSKPHKFYAVHRLLKIDLVRGQHHWWFRGDNNFLWFFRTRDPYPALDRNILWLCATIVY